MLTTVNMMEMQLIITASHGDPHTVLGMHETIIDDKPCLVVRSFVSELIDDYNSSFYYENPSYILECFLENKVL